MKVTLLPVGDVPHGLLQRLSDRLARTGIVADLEDAVPIPSDAVHAGSGQLRAEALVRLAANRSPPVLAVTGEDLEAGGYTFVFGYASVGGPGAVVSFARLRDPDPDRFLDRVVKEALHELGHTWGLDHCESPGCVMRHSESIEEADAKGENLCEVCRDRLTRAIGRPSFSGVRQGAR